MNETLTLGACYRARLYHDALYYLGPERRNNSNLHFVYFNKKTQEPEGISLQRDLVTAVGNTLEFNCNPFPIILNEIDKEKAKKLFRKITQK